MSLVSALYICIESGDLGERRATMVNLRMLGLVAYISGMEQYDHSATTSSRHEEQLLLTHIKAAKRLNISRSKVYCLIAEGKLRSVHIGKTARIAAAELERFVERLENSTE